MAIGRPDMPADDRLTNERELNSPAESLPMELECGSARYPFTVRGSDDG
jgi:hypothetical protein